MNIKYTTPFTQIANTLIHSTDLSIYEKMAYIVLCSHANRNRGCFPSYKTIARECCCSQRKVVDVIKSLEGKGYVKVKRRKLCDGNNKSNIYEILVPGACGA